MNENREVGVEEAVAGLGAAGAAGILAGPSSKTANHAQLERAMRLYESAVYPKSDPAERVNVMRDIWHRTGWFQGPDGGWKYEIPEAGATFKFLQTAGAQPNMGWESAGDLPDIDRPIGVRAEGKMSDFLDFPALYESYPGIQDVRTGQMSMEGKRGAYHPELGVGVSNLVTPEPAAGILGHELQHVVQDLEGFGQGGNPTDTGLLFPHEAANLGDMEAYKRLGGEVEARLVQQRIMDALAGEKPYTTFPIDAMDRAPMDQLIYFNSLPTGVQNLPKGPNLRLMQDSLPVSHELKATVPEASLGNTGRYLMSLLKRAL